MEGSGICIPCIEAQIKVTEESKALQKIQAEARIYMKEKSLIRVDIIKNVNDNSYDYAEKGDPRVYRDFMIIETILL